MKSHGNLFRFIGLFFFCAPLSVPGQAYYFSAPVTGYSDVGFNFGPESNGGTEMSFGTVNETVYYNSNGFSAYGQTVRVVGSVGISPVAASFSIINHNGLPVTGSGSLSINGGSSNLTFDSGVGQYGNGCTINIPVTGQGNVVSNGVSSMGTINYSFSIGFGIEVQSVTSSNLTLTEYETSGNTGSIIGTIGGVNIFDGAGGDNNYHWSWQVGPVTATLITAPTILTNPVSVTASTGGSASFTVSASGGALAYQWELNHTNIPGATSATLVLTNLTASQIGAYTVTVTNIDGSITSPAAELSLLDLNMYAGLTIQGEVGETYEVQYENNLNSNTWTTLATFILPNSPYLYFDTNSDFFAHRFYRAVKQ